MFLINLPKDWHRYEIAAGVEEDRPGIYEWHVEGRGSYIGKYKRIRRPTKEYGRNVSNLLNDKPYRLGKPDRFRRIHRELALAYRERRLITLKILENVEPVRIDRREQALIAERGILNGPHYRGRITSQSTC